MVQSIPSKKDKSIISILNMACRPERYHRKRQSYERSLIQEIGPFFLSHSKSRDNLNVEQQAYQGGTYVGNHVHKLLKV